MKIALYIKESIEESEELSTLLISKISEYNLEFDQENPDVVIVVGGDGTLLRAVHEYIDRAEDIAFVGIHQGTLGFTCDYRIDELDELFSSLAFNTYSKVNINLIEANINGHTIYAVNEIRIENPFHTLVSDIYVNGELLENFRGNGLVVSSSFGSSGYNKSLGGAVVSPSIKALQLKEIAPITNRVYQSFGSSLVLSEDNVISFKGCFNECVIGYDHLTMSAQNVNDISISVSNKSTNIIYKKDYTYCNQLKSAFIK